MGLAGALKPIPQIIFVRVQFTRPRKARSVLAVALAAQNRTDGVARDARVAGDLSDALALSV
jgi:hypothetical protein